MYHEMKHKDQIYRIISEPATIQHPDKVIMAIFNISSPGNATEVHRFEGRHDNELDSLLYKAKKYVDDL
jgi:hypothetical protein